MFVGGRYCQFLSEVATHVCRGSKFFLGQKGWLLSKHQNQMQIHIAVEECGVVPAIYCFQLWLQVKQHFLLALPTLIRIYPCSEVGFNKSASLSCWRTWASSSVRKFQHWDALRVVTQCRWVDSLTRRLLPRRAIHHGFFAALSEKGKDHVWVSTYCALQEIQCHWQTLNIFAFLALAPASNLNLIYLGAKLQSCHKQYATHTVHVVSKHVKETSGSCCRYCKSWKVNVVEVMFGSATCSPAKLSHTNSWLLSGKH